jgi:hypothetical protein
VTDAIESLTPGSPVTVQFIENADEAVVTHPGGERVTLLPEGGEMIFADTLRPGLYRVDLRRNGDLFKSERFAVNLFDPAESRIEPQENLTVGTSTISRDAREETARREFWPWVAGTGLAALVAEWWVYHHSLRRIPSVTLAGLRGTPVSQTRSLRTFLNRLPRRSRSRRRLVRTR